MSRSAVRILLLYTPIVLVAGSLVSDAPTASATVGLVVLYVSCLLAAWWPGFLVSALASALVAPVLAAPYLGAWSVLLTVPVLGAVARALNGLAPALVAVHPPVRRSLSPLATSIGAALVAIFVIAVVLSSAPLALGSGFLILAGGIGAAVESARLGHSPLRVERRDMSVRAGERIAFDLEVLPAGVHGVALFSLAGQEGAAIREPGPFALEELVRNVVSVGTSVGGPSEVVLRASVSDPLGLIHVGQSLNVAHLNVIPRARVARWAAEEFLAHRGGGPESSDALSREVAGLLAAQQGVEYVTSRLYVPGDALVSIDWKHTSRLQSLVVKTFDDGSRSAGLILVNLSVTDADEADRLVYEFLSAALTIATLSYGASVALYDHSSDGGSSPVLWGSELVRAALNACVDVRMAPAWRRVLRPVSLQELEGRVSRVRRAAGEVAPKLASLLALKEQAVRMHLEGEPLGVLLRSSQHRYHPAWCVAISAMHRDADAVLTGLRQMERSGVRTKLVNVGVRVPRSGRGEQP